MADNSIRKTQARAAERERRRQREERNKKLSIVIPLAVIAMIAVLAVGYTLFTQTNQPARPTNAGVAGPRLQVDRDQIDLGKQRLDNTVRAVFNLKNVGDGTLTLNVPRTVTLLQGC
ncbi:MAG TPA: hypothetical protein VF478_01725 [Anaerolineae bacterium]